jgi:DNA invertase Pin-like site-specific DNA recombinase
MTSIPLALTSGLTQLEGDAGRPPGKPPDDAETRTPTTVAVRRPGVGLRPDEPVLGYVSAPMDTDGSGVRASRRAIELASERAGWRLLDVLHDHRRQRTMRRPALLAALERIADGEARGLIVSHARLLGHSIADLAGLMSWFHDAQAAFIALDLGLDTSTPEGNRVATALIRVSGWDRGGRKNGAPHGLNGHNGLNGHDGRSRRSTAHLDEQVLERLGTMHDDGMSLQEIADQLNAEGAPTLYGGDVWWPSSVRTALRYARARSATRADGLPSLADRRRS